jgi:predicted methyltransferase
MRQEWNSFRLTVSISFWTKVYPIHPIRNTTYVITLFACMVCILALMDTFLCNESNLRKVEQYLAEMHRVLKPSGSLLIISHGVPAARLEFFSEAMWSVDPVEIREYKMYH